MTCIAQCYESWTMMQYCIVPYDEINLSDSRHGAFQSWNGTGAVTQEDSDQEDSG